MLRGLSEEKVFKDPVHHSVFIQDPTIWKLIDTPEFQRLRRIRQLGTSYMTFHGAEHSRFSHSLGVYEITRKIISQFERNGYPDWPQEERLVSLCAALLHDVGHGPFSHSLEQVFGTHHEKWTCEILLGDTGINRVLREADPSLPERVSSVICKTYGQPIVVSLVSSQMDADRMDYLLRDSYFTGVHYGTFDLDRILRVLRPYKGKIVVKETGMHAVEAYLMSRYQMYWQVYFHPVTRSSEIVLRSIFKRARILYRSDYRFEFLLPPLRRLFDGELTVGDYLELDEAMVQTSFGRWTGEKDPILSDLCKRFLNRQLYKYIPMEHRDETTLSEFRRQWREIGLDPDYYLEVDTPTDLPYDVYDTDSDQGGPEKPPILLLDDKERLTEISEKSEIIRSIAKVQRGKYHIYYPEELVQEHADRLSPDIRKLLYL
ncbi:HD domain-containing protein [Cohnella pontilimi]|uniref:HD domain-containing protein n=1 Tax=Cohnella pontilimi TaxID=2564100 RepID=A0A4U0F285_9BACL|nr:HD domain-containing protein [Cohnella pontilimi]TJY38587.1 HD domain-containing protein [Cohnella pontilimi]